MTYLKLVSWETGNNIWLPDNEIGMIIFEKDYTRIKTKSQKTIKVLQDEDYFDNLLMPQLPQPGDYDSINYTEDEDLPF